MRNFIIALSCIAALAGCDSRSAQVSFTPSTLKDCQTSGVPFSIEVHWDATQAKPKNGVKLWISNKKAERTGVFGGDPGTLWLQGGDVGSKATGAWVYPGTTFIVTDSSNDDVLATAKVPGVACK